MSFSSTALLQFDDLKALLARYAGSTAGRTIIEALEPQHDRFALEAHFADAGEAVAYLRELSGVQQTADGAPIRLHFDQLPEIDSSLRTLPVEGASLDGREILDLFKTLTIAA
jgi:dsDNA-specific endonuclease/ATPase MutS2